MTVHLIRGAQRTIEQLSRGPDERPACTILRISRLLPDQHHRSGRWPFSEDRVRGATVQIATGTAGHSVAKDCEIRIRSSPAPTAYAARKTIALAAQATAAAFTECTARSACETVAATR